jgi:hypothetical protein
VNMRANISHAGEPAEGRTDLHCHHLRQGAIGKSFLDVDQRGRCRGCHEQGLARAICPALWIGLLF